MVHIWIQDEPHLIMFEFDWWKRLRKHSIRLQLQVFLNYEPSPALMKSDESTELNPVNHKKKLCQLTSTCNSQSANQHSPSNCLVGELPHAVKLFLHLPFFLLCVSSKSEKSWLRPGAPSIIHRGSKSCATSQPLWQNKSLSSGEFDRVRVSSFSG